MVKKAIQLDKDNKHPFNGETVYFGTKHDKARVLSPLFANMGMTCITLEVDTDEFGTFTGEIERKGSIKETLRKKVDAVLKTKPEARFILASEGSFGPHPVIGLMKSDHEMLLFFDAKSKLEIFVDEISLQTNHDQLEFGPKDDLHGFLEKIGFPAHAVIVRPKGNSEKIVKGLCEFKDVGQAIIDSFLLSAEARVILSTDMRACYNPTRMKVIEKAGKKLIERLTTFCPSCDSVGFGPIRGIKGLPCSECGLPTQVTKEIVYGCISCNYESLRKREDGIKWVEPAECDFCNP